MCIVCAHCNEILSLSLDLNLTSSQNGRWYENKVKNGFLVALSWSDQSAVGVVIHATDDVTQVRTNLRCIPN